MFSHVSFAQLLVLWMGNMKDDVSFYTDRGFNPTMPNGWRWVAAVLILFHFFLPFFILLGRENKRRARTLDSPVTRIIDRVRDWRSDARFGVIVLIGIAVIAGVIWYRIGIGGGSAGASSGAPAAVATTAPSTTLVVVAHGAPATGTSATVAVHVAGAVNHPGVVELSGLALLNAAFGSRPPADRLLVNWDDGYVTLLLARGEWPLLVRTLVGEAAASPDEVAREVGNTLIYYRERLGGTALAQAVVRSALLPADQALSLLEGPLEMKPELLEPWPAVRAGEMGRAGQTLAGAAACVVGSRR